MGENNRVADALRAEMDRLVGSLALDLQERALLEESLVWLGSSARAEWEVRKAEIRETASFELSRRRRFARIEVVPVPSWGAALAPWGQAFLQARGDDLYLRLQGVSDVPRGLILCVQGRGRERRKRLRVVRSSRPVFALPYLNGESGELWRVDGADAELVLRGPSKTLRLTVDLPGGARILDSFPMPTVDPRKGTCAYLGVIERRQALVAASDRLIRSYCASRPDGFRAALRTLVRYRDGWRTLSKMTNLIISALVAEIGAAGRRSLRTYGCLEELAGHPTLLYDVNERG